MTIINDAKIKSLSIQYYEDGDKKGQPRQYKFTVEPGMYVLVRKTGSKLWQHQYNFKDKEKGVWKKRVLSYGSYPNVSLREARDKYYATTELLENGIDPIKEKARIAQEEADKQIKEQLEKDRLEKFTFEKMAHEWHSIKSPEWSDKHKVEVMSSLKRFMLPKLGKMPIDTITRKDIMDILKGIENRPNPPLTALRKVRQRVESIFWYVIDTYEIIDNNPAANIKSTSFKKVPVQNLRALKPEELPELMEKIDSYTGFITTKLALKTLVHTFVRHSELRYAQWSEIDWDKHMWTIPKERMKADKDHLVPLSKQVIEILRELESINGHYPFIFASNHKPNTQPISENAILVMLKNIGMWQKTTAHGLRSTFSSLANEQQINPDVIERQLAHSPSDKVRAAYNRSEYLPQRIELMQWYSDWIDK